MSWPCIAGYCVDWEAVAAIPLLPLALLGGCTFTHSSKETSYYGSGNSGELNQSGTCEDSFSVESSAKNYMRQICSPASYRILFANANAFKCINGKFESKISFECYVK